MKKLPDDYELSEADIDKTLNWLGFVDPQNATPEQAIDFLIFMRIGIHEKARDIAADDLDAWYKKFKDDQSPQ